MGSTACGRRLARSLSSHLQRRRGSGVREVVPQVRGNARSGYRSPSEERGDACHDQVSEQKIVNWELGCGSAGIVGPAPAEASTGLG